jgi:hypothetical protein
MTGEPSLWLGEDGSLRTAIPAPKAIPVKRRRVMPRLLEARIRKLERQVAGWDRQSQTQLHAQCTVSIESFFDKVCPQRRQRRVHIPATACASKRRASAVPEGPTSHVYLDNSRLFPLSRNS